MNDIYSAWLLVSDIDGTLLDKKRRIPKNNITAIKSFVNNGGNFTLCSGRNLQSLGLHYKKIDVKTPAICLNGAGIYDFLSDKELFYTPISLEGEQILLDICNKHKTAQLTVFDMNTVYLYTYKCIYGRIVSILDGLSHKLCKNKSDLPTGKWGKATIVALPNVCKKIEKFLKNSDNQKIFNCFYTSPISLEIVHNGVNKGSAVAKLADYLKIDAQNIAAIGDYYNDEAMLRSVNHPVCCGQAPDDIKALCEYVTCHCDDGAVNDFINYIETNYIKRR